MLVRILRYILILPDVYLAFTALASVKLFVLLPQGVLLLAIFFPLILFEKLGAWRTSLLYFSIYVGVLSLKGNVLFGNALSEIVVTNPYLSWSYTSLFVISAVIGLYLDSLIREEKIYHMLRFPKEDVEIAVKDSLLMLTFILVLAIILTITGYLLLRSLWTYLLNAMRGEPYYVVPLLVFVLGASTILLLHSNSKVYEIVVKVRLQLGSSFRVRHAMVNERLTFEIHSEGSIGEREIVFSFPVEKEPKVVTVKGREFEKSLDLIERVGNTSIYSNMEGQEV